MLIAINILLILAVLIVLAGIGMYLYRITVLMGRIRKAAGELSYREQGGGGAAPDQPGPGCRILIELADPIALAHRESKMARMVSEIAPQMITRAVYRQLRRELLQSLAQREIDARVTIQIC